MTPEQLFIAVNNAVVLENCTDVSTREGARGNLRTTRRDSSGEACKGNYICNYSKRRVLEIGRDVLETLNVPSARRPALLEGLGEIYDREAVNMEPGCKQVRDDKKKKLIRNVAIGTGVAAVLGVGTYYFFFRGR
tara:strand:- start:4659 stop:5063 length:405 start_codon:yes stop_codon:yes gene_type:complete